MLKRKLLKDGKYKNKSLIFLLPIIEIDLTHISDKHNYLVDVNFIEKDNRVVLIFETVDYEPLKMDLYKLSISPYYKDSLYADDDKEVCFFFEIPSGFIEDFKLFLEGKYTQFSDKYKDMLINKYGRARGKGFNNKDFPIIGVYDAISPLKETKELIAKRLSVNVDIIKEVLDPPNKEKEEFKSAEELSNE